MFVYSVAQFHSLGYYNGNKNKGNKIYVKDNKDIQ